MKKFVKKILVSQELSDINFERLTKAMVYMKSNLIDSDNNMYLTVDQLIGVNKSITGWNNITLRKTIVEPY